MATTAQKQITGKPNVRARYDCDEGTRQLVAQRVRGVVALSDVPAGEEGRVHLVERRLESLAELDALVADYVEKAAALGRCPMASADWWNVAKAEELDRYPMAPGAFFAR